MSASKTTRKRGRGRKRPLSELVDATENLAVDSESEEEEKKAPASKRPSKKKSAAYVSDSDSEDVENSEESSGADESESEEEEGEGPFKMDTIYNETVIIVKPADSILKREGIFGTQKVAGFDMDFTLVKPKSGAKFPKSRKDWKWLFPAVPKRLRKLHKKGYAVVIFTNQNGIGNGKQKASDVTMKIVDISQELGIPLTALLSTQKDHWRKPGTSLWKLFEEECNDGVAADRKLSFYVGDAGGRPKQWDGRRDTKRDFSCSDRKFAHNLAVPFHTEGAFFNGDDECDTWQWRSFDPLDFTQELKAKMAAATVDGDDEEDDDSGKENASSTLASASSSSAAKRKAKSAKTGLSMFEGSLPIARTDACDVVVMVGCPGSGKSTFCRRYLLEATGGREYVWINRDTLKTAAKCRKAMEAALSSGKNVVVDNTCRDAKQRQTWTTVARKLKVRSLRCFVLATTRPLAEHLNLYREKLTKSASKRVPRVAFATYFKYFTQPTLDEGFTEICKVNFVPHFADETERKLFMEYT